METYSHHSEPQPVALERCCDSWVHHCSWQVVGDDLGYTKRMVVARPVVEAWQSPEGQGTFGGEVCPP